MAVDGVLDDELEAAGNDDDVCIDGVCWALTNFFFEKLNVKLTSQIRIINFYFNLYLNMYFSEFFFNSTIRYFTFKIPQIARIKDVRVWRTHRKKLVILGKNIQYTL